MTRLPGSQDIIAVRAVRDPAGQRRATQLYIKLRYSYTSSMSILTVASSKGGPGSNARIFALGYPRLRGCRAPGG